MELVILRASPKEATITTLSDVNPSSTIQDVKKLIYVQRTGLHPDRQSLRVELKGKNLDDNIQIKSLYLKTKENCSVLYLKDLGPQIQWRTVFFWEYIGPFFCYLALYCRPVFIYGVKASAPTHPVVHIAAACWSFHYLKRILETFFVHRFSHSTMPMLNLFKNCSYYWGFSLYISYYINHPLYTPPYFGNLQIYFSLIGFFLSEIGNLSSHLVLRDLRAPGSKERKIPFPNRNPFTLMFNLVSCPNYTYEAYSWFFFSFMTQCLPAGFFAVTGLAQMSIWAVARHRNYKKEFSKYPKSRKAIIPFLL